MPWRQRHGPILRALIFNFWYRAHEDVLAASLLQLYPRDLPFRQFAFAALCLAAGRQNVKSLLHQGIDNKWCLLFCPWRPEHNANSELRSVLASEAHLQGSSPGSSPEATIYWFDNVLVILTAQPYRPGAAEEGTARAVRYCKENHSAEVIRILRAEREIEGHRSMTAHVYTWLSAFSSCETMIGLDYHYPAWASESQSAMKLFLLD